MNILFFSLTAVAFVKGADWSYEDGVGIGPSSWANAYPLCGGKSQTPINIQTTAAATCDRSTLNIAYLNERIKSVKVKNL